MSNGLFYPRKWNKSFLSFKGCLVNLILIEIREAHCVDPDQSDLGLHCLPVGTKGLTNMTQEARLLHI